MAGFCLPKELVQKVVDAVKDGRIDPAKMRDMSSSERRAFFSDLVGEHYAKDINAEVESKILLKDYKRGMVTAIKKIAGLSEAAKTDLVSRVERMDKVLNPSDYHSFLNDLAAKKLGTEITIDEAKKITELTVAARTARDTATPNLSGYSDEYLKAANNLRDYMDSLKPTTAINSIIKSVTTTARNFLLMNPATPLKTFIAQLENSATDFLTRRIGALSLESKNYDLVVQANKEAWNTYKETGDNVAAMQSVDDIGKLGEGKNFKVPSGIEATNPAVRIVEAVTRGLAKYSTKVAIDWEHNVAFTKIYQKAFYDSVNVATSMLARGEELSGDAGKARAAEVFKDASRIKPKTDIGATVRMEAQKQAARVTSTNDNLISGIAVGTKNILNEAGEKYGLGFKLGDVFMPIAKIPADIIYNSIENAGLGIPLGIKDIFEGHSKIQSEDLNVRYQGMAQYANGIQKIARTVGSLGLAAYAVSQLTNKDFRSDQYGDHYVKIGNIWINTEYIAAVSPALAGMMEVKANYKPKQSPALTAEQYSKGAFSALGTFPGVSDVFGSDSSSLFGALSTGKIGTYAASFFTQRGEPAFISNLTKNRPIERLFFGANGIETTQEVKQDAQASAKKSAATRLANTKAKI